MSDESDMCTQVVCPVCQGNRWIVLLYSRSLCPKCKGTGIILGTFSEDWEGDGDAPYGDDDEGFCD